MSLSSGDEVPHIFTRKSRLRPGKFLITGAKRVLQQYLPLPDPCSAANGTGRVMSAGRLGKTERLRQRVPIRLNGRRCDRRRLDSPSNSN